jgi:hypothetical protein
MDIDNRLSSEIRNDKLPFEMDPGAEQRLMHAANIRNAMHPVRRNSIFEPLLALFALPVTGAKIMAVTVILLFTIGTGNFMFQSRSNLHCDSTSVHQMMADTVHVSPAATMDSVVN